jgi:hypothetical protein
MSENKEYPKIVLKKKQIQKLVDFSLEEGIEFTVRQQQFPDTDWEVEMKINDINTAILTGMYLRENKLEPEGFGIEKYKKTQSKKKNGSNNSNDESDTEATGDQKNTEPKTDTTTLKTSQEKKETETNKEESPGISSKDDLKTGPEKETKLGF